MTMVDPVCGRDIDDVEYPEEIEYQGGSYWFCSLEHAQQFRAHPERYIKEETEAQTEQKES